MNNELNPPTERPAKKHKVLRRLLPAGLILLLVPLFVYYAPVMSDWVRASQFKPTTQIQNVTMRINLTDQAKRTFYATHPEVEEQQQFNTSCQSSERTTAILGCYYRDRIFLYNIQNKELDGTLEVTAAHELLHAEYQRLNGLDRKRVDDMLKQEYEKIKTQPDIERIMKYYQQAEPGDEINELHSIIGTTQATLSPELETYYRRYFKERSAIVVLNTRYNQVFSELNTQAEQLQQQIDTENTALKNDMSSYKADLEQVNLDIESFNARASGGGFASQGSFMAARNALVSRVDALNARRDDLNARVDSYNQAVEKLNNLAVRANQLNESLNGVSAPAGV